MACLNTYHVNCDSQFFYITTLDCEGQVKEVEKLFRSSVEITPDYATETVKIKGLNVHHASTSMGLSISQTITGCENAVSADNLATFNVNCVEFSPSEEFVNLVACLEQCAYGCCDGGGGGITGSPFATVLYSQNGNDPLLVLSGGTTNTECLNQFRAVLEIKNNANAVVKTFTYFNSIPKSINVNSLNLDDGFYLVTLTVIDCSNKQASDFTSFTLAPLIPPTGSLTYQANDVQLGLTAQSNDPICSGNYEASLTINNGTTDVFSEDYTDFNFPSSINLGSGGLGLSSGAYTATLVVTDCTNLSDTSILTFIVGQGNIPPTAQLAYTPSNTLLDILAKANDPTCNNNYNATLTIKNSLGVVKYTRNFSYALPLGDLDISTLGLSEGSFTATLIVVDCNGLSDTAVLTFTYTEGSTIPFVDIEYNSSKEELELDGGSTDPSCGGRFNATLIVLNLLGQQVYTDTYTEVTYPDTIAVSSLGLGDGNYIAQVTLSDCTGTTVVDSTTFAISANFSPPVATINCSDNTGTILMSAEPMEPSCGGTYTAKLEIFELNNTLVKTVNYTQATFVNEVSFLDLELPDGVYRFKLTVTNCKDLIDVSETICTVSEIPPFADIDFDGVNTVLVAGESRDPACEGIFEAEVVILDETTAVLFQSTYDNTNLPENTGIDVGVDGLDLQPGIYIATITITDCTDTPAIDSITFEIPDLLPPCADIEYTALTDQLDFVCLESKHPSCNGEFSATLTITRRVQTGGDVVEFIVYSVTWTQDTAVNPLPLAPLNLQVGEYIATITITDCTGITSTDSTEWSIADTCELVNYSDSIEDFTDNFAIVNNGNGTVTVSFNYDPSGIQVNANPPTGLSAINITNSSSRLVWGAPSSGTPIAYNVRFRRVGTSGWSTQTVPSTALFLDVQNLVAETSYEFQVQAVYEGATSSYTAAFIFTTTATGGGGGGGTANAEAIRNRWAVTVVADNHNDKSGIYKKLRWYLYQVDLSSGGATTNANNLAFDPFYGFGGNVCNSHDGCQSGVDTIIGNRYAASDVNLSLQGGASYLRPPDGGNDRHVVTDQHTNSGPVNSNSPSAYTQQATMMFQLAARLGSNAMDVNDPRLGAASGQTIKTGLGLVKRIMPWNETYEHWEHQTGYNYRSYTDLNGVTDGGRARGDWHPHEETAMMIACYNKIKEADPNMIVMWPGAVKWDGFRSDGGHWAKIVDACNQLNGGQFPADEYCVHIYWNDRYADRTQDYTQAINFSSTGAEPEAHGKLRVFVQDMIDVVHQSYPNVKVNITEIGYDVDGSPQQVKSINGKTTRQTYGDWTIRTHLALLATDVNITVQYSLDHTHAGGGGWLFGSCGVIDGNNDIAEPAWYMTKQFLDTIGNYKFGSVVQEQDGGVWTYKFEDVDNANNQAYVVWNGTASNKITSNYQLQLGAGETSPTQYKLNYNSTSTTVSSLSPNGNNIVTITVTETPQIILVNN